MKRSLIVPVTVVALVVLVGLRAGVLAAVVVGAVALVVMGGTAAVVVRLTRAEQSRRVAAPPVQHCNCCDQACLLAKVCAPGPEPAVVHGRVP